MNRQVADQIQIWVWQGIAKHESQTDGWSSYRGDPNDRDVAHALNRQDFLASRLARESSDRTRRRRRRAAPKSAPLPMPTEERTAAGTGGQPRSSPMLPRRTHAERRAGRAGRLRGHDRPPKALSGPESSVAGQASREELRLLRKPAPIIFSGRRRPVSRFSTRDQPAFVVQSGSPRHARDRAKQSKNDKEK
jgi:hypothetical protein